MGKKLVVVESPSKAKTIAKLLGGDVVVKASMGHIRDLPEKSLGVDVDHGFTPTYRTATGKSKIITELTEAAAGAEGIYLAPDPDREGEAIAWHLYEVLRRAAPPEHFYRVTYNEITAPAIRRAFEHPGRINQPRVDAQQARRVLDRIVGYKVSPLLWKRVKGALSAGRVQSVALRLVCERELDIQKFVKELFWLVGARLRKWVDDRTAFTARLVRIAGEKAEIRTAEQAAALVAEFSRREFVVEKIQRKELTRSPKPPFITSTLQQAASGALGYAPARTMSLAQRLYEGSNQGVGLITYMRTDSVQVAREAQEEARAWISATLGAEFLPPKPPHYRSRSSAQEAHEAIRPTSVARTPESLAGSLESAELKLYTLIWKRFVASQMASARIAHTAVDIHAAPTTPTAPIGVCLLRATASETLFPGYQRITGDEKRPPKDDEPPEQVLPALAEGERLECLEGLSEEKETQPPPRYSEASLVRALEQNGVGRPSTYAAIMTTIVARKYVAKEKRVLVPTAMGMQVYEFLVQHFNELFSVHFTAEMEKELDRIEEGALGWQEMLRLFYEHFIAWLGQARGPDADRGKIERLLELLSQVKEWAPEQKRGARAYSDRKFVESLRKRLGPTATYSERQATQLARIAVRHADQLPAWPTVAAELGLDVQGPAEEESLPPREESRAKLKALLDVRFDPPRTLGQRTYDDAAFCSSLNEQVNRGRRLSDRQLEFLDRLVRKYADQLGGGEVLSELGVAETVKPAFDVGALLDYLGQVKTWREPVTKGKRTWDDQAFLLSLREQFESRKELSPRQLGALQQLALRYADQLPDFDDARARFQLQSRERTKDRPARRGARTRR
ncbi:MAG: type I DNA topoisomerase [Candidatus Marinimicrobia bacterium]|nr:type I DNA topoisomerase [Candidatus Neomarinimicrobiota bacterium]